MRHPDQTPPPLDSHPRSPRCLLLTLLLLLLRSQIDLVADRVVSRAEGEALARELGTGFEETSAKTGENVLRVFEDITLRATDTREQA